MATATKRRSNTITKFLQDIVDDEDDKTETSDLGQLQAALAELTTKVDKLAKVSATK